MVDRTKLTNDITSILKGIRRPKIHKESPTLAISDNFIGIEMEVGNAPRPGRLRTINGVPVAVGTPVGWDRTEDHSLRNEGAEYITPGPTMGEDLISLLFEFEKWAREQHVSSSFRTSTHVHIDFSQQRDTLFTIHDFLMGYYLLEEAYFGFADPSRSASGYCFAFSDTDFELLTILRAQTPEQLSTVLGSIQRYYGCNPAALAVHGTIEFRHLPLIIEADVVIQWINMILRLKKFVMDNCTSMLNILEVVDKVGIQSFAEYVLGPEYKRLSRYIKEDVINKRRKMLASVYAIQLDRTPNRMAAKQFNIDKNPIFSKLTAKPVKSRKKIDKPHSEQPNQSPLVTVRVNEGYIRALEELNLHTRRGVGRTAYDSGPTTWSSSPPLDGPAHEAQVVYDDGVGLGNSVAVFLRGEDETAIPPETPSDSHLHVNDWTTDSQ
jgi:hypothetical protein